jgi:hypothetical protein
MTRLIAGGNWNNGANCGSRSSNWNNSVLNLNSNNGCRAVADTKTVRRLPKPIDRFWLALEPWPTDRNYLIDRINKA